MLSGLSHVSHFEALLLFAAFASAAIGTLARRTTPGKIRYALWSFALFVIFSVGIAWLMYPFSR
jgi:hypothetical protein